MSYPIHTITRAIIIDKGHIFLAYSPNWPKGSYYLPGGHIEGNETAQSALLRELEEEIGLPFRMGRFLGCMENIFEPQLDDNVCHTHEFNLLFLVYSDVLKYPTIPPVKEETVLFNWVALEDLGSVDLMPQKLIHAIPKWLNLELSDAFEQVSSHSSVEI